MAAKASQPFTFYDTYIEAAVRAAPKSSRNCVIGIATGADDHAVIKVALTAAPEGGKANTQLLKLLAKEWGMPRTSLSISRGATSRQKTIVIEAEPTKVRPLLMDWMERQYG